MPIYKLKIEDLNIAFLEKIRQLYKKADVEINIHPVGEATHLAEEDFFWVVIDALDWSQGEDDEAVLKPAIHKLSQESLANIFQFDEILSEKLYRLDGKKYAEHLGAYAYREGENFSTDHFLYARCCVVANGRQFYESVLEDPARIPKEHTFESLIYLAQKAYEFKTGNEDYNFVPSYCIETFCNPEGWGKTPMSELFSS